MGNFKGINYRNLDVNRRKSGPIPLLSENFIRSNVGDGSQKRPGDTYKVQRLLNIVGSKGIISGKMLPLKLDGDFGKATRTRLNEYQLARFAASDGLVEVGGPTISSLLLQSYSLSLRAASSDFRVTQAAPAALPINGAAPIPDSKFIPEERDVQGHIIPRMNDAERVAMIFDTLPEVERLADAFLKVVKEAQANTGGSYDNLFCKHFHHRKETFNASRSELARAASIVGLVRKEATRRRSVLNGDFASVSRGKMYDGSPVDVIFFSTWVGAGTYGGSWIFDDQYTKEIWAGPRVDYLGRWYLARQVFHELCHYSGGTKHSGEGIIDEGYTQMEEHNAYLSKDMYYSSLLSHRRIRNADTYAALALDALHGTEVCKGFQNNPMGEFDRSPEVDFAGVLFGGKINAK